MCKYRKVLHVLACLLLLSQTGCWSSKEIEDLSIYTGLALDKAELSPVEQEMEEKGDTYPKRNKVTATVQIVPEQSSGSSEKGESQRTLQYLNISETGDSVFEVFRQYSVRRDRPIIGHHLKVIIVASQLAKEQKMRQLMDFILRDNDIRPSCLVFLSEEKAVDTLTTKLKGEIPSFHILEMLRNNYRTSKVMEGVIISELDALMNSKRSYILQNIVKAAGEVAFSGAGIIKGETSNWIGNLSEQDVQSIAWITGKVKGGAIKTYDKRNEPITYEVKSLKSKIKAEISQGKVASFHVEIKSEGRLIENWDGEENPSELKYLEEAEELFEGKLREMLESCMETMQSKYKVEVAGFGDRLSIEKPHIWKKVKDNWDETFSHIPVTFDVKFTITDYGSSTE
ncbi:Ger(x)C family spore germination protein [Paenibacillus albidus]|uniref:Ger(x)C family spore germination protein n=1 Tax=Paenibacillus albidus TaxID=2041023 RepID=UPI001BEB5678|nr:Ger(x)C family spore germination protein [Paenibacillus albidus]MBT2289393.1 Ger(x)C family spore germination protein [Paenibacillus albidus]